jgi:hypothetical protein
MREVARRGSTEHMSGITRTSVGNHPNTKRRQSTELTQSLRAPPRIRTENLRIKKGLLSVG